MTTAPLADMGLESPGRRSFYRRWGIDPARVCAVRQIHSRSVVAVDGEIDRWTDLGEQFWGEADGLVCAVPGTALAVTVADCMPIYIHDEHSGAFGLLHSGWRGTGILASALELMQVRYGCRLGALRVLLGPCISATAYAVDAQRASAFKALWGAAAVRREGERWFLDMRGANLAIAERAGVGSVDVLDACTFADERLGSSRREGAGRYTRMLAMVGEPVRSVWSEE